MDGIGVFSAGFSYPEVEPEIERSTSVHLLAPEQEDSPYRVHGMNRYTEGGTSPRFEDAFTRFVRRQLPPESIVVDITSIGTTGFRVLKDRLRQLYEKNRLPEGRDHRLIPVVITHRQDGDAPVQGHRVSRRDLAVLLHQARFEPTQGSITTPQDLSQLELDLDPGITLPAGAPVSEFWRIGDEDDLALSFALAIWALENEEAGTTEGN